MSYHYSIYSNALIPHCLEFSSDDPDPCENFKSSQLECRIPCTTYEGLCVVMQKNKVFKNDWYFDAIQYDFRE